MAKQVQESGKASWDDSPIREKLQHLPDASGVYQFRSVSGDILYIGKAKSLRQRVRSYFQPSANHTLRIQIMVSLVHDVTLIVTDTEAEALILEEQLIKSHRPRYNVLLKDDKSYPFCKLTVNERYPRLFLVREKHDPQAEYYGPYPSVKDARQVLRVVSRYFPLRTSKMVLDGTKAYRPCLNFQLRRCIAPCRGTVEVSEYQQVVNHVRMFLRGRDKELMGDFETDMQEASERLEFERAAAIRDQIQSLKRVFERQMVLSTKGEDQDVLNLYREGESSVVQVLFIRNGRLLGSDFFYESGSSEASEDNLLGLVLNRLYTGESAHIPREILLPFSYSDQEALAEALNKRAERRVYVSVPKKGRKHELVTMAFNNAKFNLTEQRGRLDRESNVLEQVQRFLRLRKLPEMVEAFDISHLSGTMTVASMVCWKQNRPCKEGYRKYRIRSVSDGDDFASMEEVLARRYKRVASGEMPLPDLILIDGGKGQVNAAAAVLQRLGIHSGEVELLGLAKGRSERRGRIRRKHNEDFEYVVRPNQKNEIRLPRNSVVLHFLQNIRDETHRFAIEFQRALKRKQNLRSLIDEIPGVGPQRKRGLLRHFGSLKRLQSASVAEIAEAPGIPEALAVEIHAFLCEAEQYIRNQTREVSASAKALSRAESQTVARLDSSRWSAKIS